MVHIMKAKDKLFNNYLKPGSVAQGNIVKKYLYCCAASVALVLIAGNSCGEGFNALEIQGKREYHAEHIIGNIGKQQENRMHQRKEGDERHENEAHRHPHFHEHGRVIVGIPFLVEPPIYVSPPSDADQYPPDYIDPASGYAYYCTAPAGYYPSVQNCLGEWLRVVPYSEQP
jgi:hypothetical protein